MKKSRHIINGALAFIILMGIVSLFSDMTHEGAKSILGDYLSLLGASAATIGFISGLGDLIGYGCRLLTGIVADKTKKYWPMTIIGYAIDVLAIPLLCLVPKGGWALACVFIILERMGKAIKKPAKDTLLSFASYESKAGKSFALQEVLDQFGAFLGPIVLYIVMMVKKGSDLFETYQLALLILGVPALICLIILFFAHHKYPHPETFEPDNKADSKSHFKPSFFLYLVAIGFLAFGFLDFNIISMHIGKIDVISREYLPLIYSFAMLIDALGALFFGYLFDRFGTKAIAISTLIALPFSLFIFSINSLPMILVGVALWGLGMGAQESILKATITKIVSKDKRSTGFGIFETTFGISLFLGSFLMGVFYDISLPLLITVSVISEAIAVPLFFLVAHIEKKEKIDHISNINKEIGNDN